LSPSDSVNFIEPLNPCTVNFLEFTTKPQTNTSLKLKPLKVIYKKMHQFRVYLGFLGFILKKNA